MLKCQTVVPIEVIILTVEYRRCRWHVIVDEILNVAIVIPVLFCTADFHLKCNIDIVAYSGYVGPCSGSNDGHVDINGRRVWEAGWCSLKPNLRGINTMILDPIDCSVSDLRRFDTWWNISGTHDFISYFDYFHTGALLIGVTGDEPTRYLEPALPRLRAAGVRVEDVQFRGSFAFVTQIGHPENTQFIKSLTNEQRTKQMRVSIRGNLALHKGQHSQI